MAPVLSRQRVALPVDVDLSELLRQPVGLLEHRAQRLRAEHRVPAGAFALGHLRHLAAEVQRQAHVVVRLADRRLEGAGLVGGGDRRGEAGLAGTRARRRCRSRRRRRACGRPGRSGGWRGRLGSTVPSSSTLRMKAFLSISPSSPKAPSATFSSRRSATRSAADPMLRDLLGEVGEVARQLRPLLEGRLLRRPGCAAGSATRRCRRAGSVGWKRHGLARLAGAERRAAAPRAASAPRSAFIAW